ncbi:hypothetical protein M408DRAFT_291299 [Serendipita vermifera MAFF 305830]|uniref:Meiotic nuclear division protein 1 n=1 Tax=Serendipita vermifera MAFF 305830 TaxID=933852 RepID=A0A0C2W7A5_SERVB|nr:hypothetical protein M408DRAFT_291299 [Serendipita vermifera MAFF 305830]
MSSDEKRVKILELFHETKDFFQLKEIEKLASKKGVVEKTVKEILLSLVADGLVQSDKIGASNFFWSFPSAQGATLRNKVNAAQQEHENLSAKIQECQEVIVKEQQSRVDSVERQTSLEEFQSLQEELAALQSELRAYGRCDPEHLAQKNRAIFLAKEATLRWTDNTVIARDHFVRNFALSLDEVNQHFSIPIDFEDIE